MKSLGEKSQYPEQTEGTKSKIEGEVRESGYGRYKFTAKLNEENVVGGKNITKVFSGASNNEGDSNAESSSPTQDDREKE